MKNLFINAFIYFQMYLSFSHFGLSYITIELFRCSHVQAHVINQVKHF